MGKKEIPPVGAQIKIEDHLAKVIYIQDFSDKPWVPYGGTCFISPPRSDAKTWIMFSNEKTFRLNDGVTFDPETMVIVEAIPLDKIRIAEVLYRLETC